MDGHKRPELDDELYDAASRARLVGEPPKRVDAPVRLAFERDRARVDVLQPDLTRCGGFTARELAAPPPPAAAEKFSGLDRQYCR